MKWKSDAAPACGTSTVDGTSTSGTTNGTTDGRRGRRTTSAAWTRRRRGRISSVAWRPTIGGRSRSSPDGGRGSRASSGAYLYLEVHRLKGIPRWLRGEDFSAPLGGTNRGLLRGACCLQTERHIPGPPDGAAALVLGRDGMGSPVASEEVRSYFADLLSQVDSTYAVARAARARGVDPELDVEIPLTDDLASRVERLLENYEVEGVARRIRELAKDHDREELAILVAKEMAQRPAASKEKAVERAVRVGLAILTEGILVAPLEGLATVKIKRNRDGTSYVDLSYAGPIRSAGGTGQALSVLIADVVRRELGIGRYQPAREEVERFKEEIPLYRQVQHLQYTPSEEEISLIVSNCPVSINGEGTEDAEISGFRDLPRIETNRIRGG